MFTYAIPVWGDYKDGAEKLNRHLIFRETVGALNGVELKIAAADFYRLTVNGEFVGFGPARTAKGYARVDAYDLSELRPSDDGKNEIVIEVAGYHCKSLSTIVQDSFLCAEITENGQVTRYTGRDFGCFESPRRVRKTERYSVQRHFGEIYVDGLSDGHSVNAVPVADGIKFIPRRVPYAHCEVTDVCDFLSRGAFIETEDGRAGSGEYGTGAKQNAYSFPPEQETEYGFFSPDEVVDKPYRYVGGIEKTRLSGEGTLPITLSSGEWLMVDLRMIVTGFLRFDAHVKEDCDVILAFSELCEKDVFSFRNVNLQGVVEYKLSAGRATEESFEPYTFRHVAVFVKKGTLTLNSVGYRTFERNTERAKPGCFKKAEHNEIYRAALRTFAHNAVDIFTDCPSRERAGWLCDSFFTARAEYFFFGETPVEDAFLENYVLYESDGTFPRGVLPMCYPGEAHQNKKFIPQWDMWYVLEVCEYLEERRPDMDREIFRPSVMGVLGFLEKYENGDGLLEDLPSWNFVEWSDANSWTQNVNYPTNFLYSAVLEAVAKVFSRPELMKKSESIRKKTAELSFNGEVFVDHAVRKDNGELENQKHISEACQYYAILYGGIDIDAPEYARLKSYVIDDFKSFDLGENKFCPKNAFIGLYLRMNVLMNMKDSRLLAKNLEVFCLHMSRTTGTLWEYRDGKGSLDHGFASYVALTIPRADALSE